jgi:hypothetical protein
LPAASYSSSVAWGVYIAASFILVVVCSPVLNGVRGYAYTDSIAETGEGVVRVFDSLEPGVTTTFTFHAPASDGRLVLAGRNVTVAWGGKSSTFETMWLLPIKTLEPSVPYALEVTGKGVEVFDLVRV